MGSCVLLVSRLLRSRGDDMRRQSPRVVARGSRFQLQEGHYVVLSGPLRQARETRLQFATFTTQQGIKAHSSWERAFGVREARAKTATVRRARDWPGRWGAGDRAERFRVLGPGQVFAREGPRRTEAASSAPLHEIGGEPVAPARPSRGYLGDVLAGQSGSNKRAPGAQGRLCRLF